MRTKRTRHGFRIGPHGRRLLVGFVATLATMSMTLVPAAQPAMAHGDSSTVSIYNPLIKGSNPSAVSGWWPWGSAVAPASHHIVWSNYGYSNDWSIDVFAKTAGRRIVTPFGSTTDTGHSVRSEVLQVAPACASGNIADGGYRVRIRAVDETTGAELGRADLAHVDNPQVGVGDTLNSWTTIGYTSAFHYNSCYQVSTSDDDWLHHPR